jgi:hypothetical protein
MTSKTDKALIVGGGAGTVALLLSSLFPNFNILQPFSPGQNPAPPPPLTTRLEWSILIGGVFAILAYYG